MKKFISSTLIIAMCVTAFAGCSKKEEAADTDIKEEINVTVHKAIQSDINSEVNYTGEIKSAGESEVAPKITATIKSINYDIGDYVVAGSVLAVLDDTDYALAYNQALAAYNQATASYSNVVNSLNQSTTQLETAVSSAKIEYENASDNYDRQKALYDAGAISKVTFEQAETRLKNAELALTSAKTNYDTAVKGEDSSIASAQAAVDSAKVALDSATNNINNTQIVAPISGYIASKNGNIGQIAAAGYTMFSIKDAKEVNVEISVTESIIPYITAGTKANITVATAGIKDMEGIVSVVNTVKNPQTGMYTVQIRIDNSSDVLKIGMMADVILETRSVKNVITIPSESIIQDGEEYYVYVVKDNIAEKRVVTIGISNNNFTEITGGINTNEIIVVSGKEYISDKNNTVKIVEE